MRTFDLKTSLILWDFLLVEGDPVIFKLTYTIFGLLNEHFSKLNFDNFFEEIKILILKHQKQILKKLIQSEFTLEDDLESVKNILAERKTN